MFCARTRAHAHTHTHQHTLSLSLSLSHAQTQAPCHVLHRADTHTIRPPSPTHTHTHTHTHTRYQSTVDHALGEIHTMCSVRVLGVALLSSTLTFDTCVCARVLTCVLTCVSVCMCVYVCMRVCVRWRGGVTRAARALVLLRSFNLHFSPGWFVVRACGRSCITGLPACKALCMTCVRACM